MPRETTQLLKLRGRLFLLDLFFLFLQEQRRNLHPSQPVLQNVQLFERELHFLLHWIQSKHRFRRLLNYRLNYNANLIKLPIYY